MIKELPEEMKDILLDIYNKIWIEGRIPEMWRMYQVIFIDKIGKEKVRPIALSSCVGKLMERLVNERLIWWAEKEEKIARSQNGFRRGRSCVENLTKITTYIRVSNYKDNYTLATFLDVTSAYDNIIYSILIKKLIDMRCPKNIIRFVSNWLYCRTTEFVINCNESVQRMVTKGLPQGAVLSPLLYDLYTSDIMTDVDDAIQKVEFADDIAIFTTSENRIRNKQYIEEAVNIIRNNLIEIRLELEPKKTVLVEFSKQGGYDKNLYINVEDTKIYNQKGTKFLGIWLDNKLNFHRQVQEVRGKVNKANSIMKYLNKKSKGIEVNTALMLYKSIVRSITDYSNFVYFPKEVIWQFKLKRTQYMGLRTALGYRNNTPNNVIIAEAKVRLLKDRAEMLARNFLSKIMIYGEEAIMEKLDELIKHENYARYRQPMHKKSMLGEAWERVRWFKNKVGKNKKFEIFRTNYKTVTRDIEIDLTTGYYRNEESSSDEELTRKIMEKYKIKN